jgi:hypothetical protein
MVTWHAPPGSTLETPLIRLFAGSSLRENPTRCPYKVAIKSRPGLKPAPGPLPTWKGGPRETFNLGPLTNTLDLHEYGGQELEEALHRALGPREDGPAVDAGLATWTRFAVREYQRGGTGCLLPVPYSWVLVTQLNREDARGVKRYEQCVWGRPYASADGRIRELWVPVPRPLRDRSGDGEDSDVGDAAGRADLIAAAQVIARGEPHRLPSRFLWKRDAAPVPGLTEAAWRLPDVVRIREVSCVDGERQLVLSGTPQEIAERYAEVGVPALTAAVSGNELVPGHDCEDCKYAPTCPALDRQPGLLGIEDRSRPRRTWSVTNGRSYLGRPGRDEGCAARERLRRLRLPDLEGRELTPHVVRGHAVHAWIQERHERHPGVACRPGDAPDGRSPWSAGRWTVPAEQADLGARMIAAHARYCPYKLATVTDLVHERTLVVHDTAADVLVLAKADTLYRDGPSWVYRETKTDARRDPPPETDLLRQRPQLALAVLLASRAVLGEDVSAARVEMEILGPRGARLVIIDPHDPEIRARAQQVVHELTANWHTDTTAAPSPGPHCEACEMATWCRPPLPTNGVDVEKG